jgi:cell division protein FtsI (penicillin-binding protein 3)
MLRARRLVYVFSAMLFVALGGLALRLVWLQVGGHDDGLARRARLAQGASLELARRGALRDRHGQVLADSVEQMRVTSYGRDITHDGRSARKPEDVQRSLGVISQRLAPLLGQPAEAIAPQLVRTTADGRPQLAYVGEAVTDPAAIDALLALRDGDLRRIGLEPRWERRYPAAATGGNLLGVVNFEGQGAFGLELGLQKALSCGADGAYPHLKLGSFRVAAADREPVSSLSGYDVELTVDAVLQRVLHEELAAGCARLRAVGGSAVLLDVRTGDILGMVSAPGLDPADSRTWTASAQVFRPAQTVYSPGSTFKPLMLATALDLGLVAPGDMVDCSPERGSFGKRRISDTHPIKGLASLETIMVESSNVGMANILTRLVPEGREKDTELMRPVHEKLTRLGILEPTGVPIPSESAGLLTPLPQWSRNYTLVSLAFGHEVSVTPLQMAGIAASLADGQWRRPRLVRAFVDEAGQRIELPLAPPVPVFRPETADVVRGYMQAVVEKGQAKVAGVPGVTVAGKTGTTVHEPKKGEKGGKAKETHSFIALVPADDPQLALVVAIEQPQGFRYAAQTVAPVAGAILGRAVPYLGLAPTR